MPSFRLTVRTVGITSDGASFGWWTTGQGWASRNGDHDVHYPFECPREWVLEGRAWNEVYLLRAVLQFNDVFEIVCMNTALEVFQPDWFRQHMPLCMRNTGGSIWLRRAR